MLRFPLRLHQRRRGRLERLMLHRLRAAVHSILQVLEASFRCGPRSWGKGVNHPC